MIGFLVAIQIATSPAAAEESLEAMAARSGADAVCEVQFVAGARRAEQIEVSCSDGAGAAARQAAITQIDWRRERRLGDFSRNRIVRDRLDLDITENGEWRVRPELLFRVPPQYPAREAARSATANCRVRYDIVDGTPDVHGTQCVTDGSDRAFGRAAAQAVELWIYTRNSNRSCVLVTLEFGLQDPGAERFGTEATPTDPPCPHEE